MNGSRWVGAAGVALVVLLILSFAVYSGGGFGAPEADRSDSTILDWYTDSGNQVRVLFAAMIGALAVVAFLGFLVGFRRLLDDAGAPGALAELSFVGGLVLAILSFVGIAIGTSIAATATFSDTFDLDPDTARIVLMIGNLWLPAISGVPGGLFVGAACLASRRAGFLPAWLNWIGFVLAVLSVLAFPGFGANAYLPVVWVLLASIVLLRRNAKAHAQVQS